ncbi:hypothetical protein ACQ4LE_006934 [Meloidogyne hapla]
MDLLRQHCSKNWSKNKENIFEEKIIKSSTLKYSSSFTTKDLLNNNNSLIIRLTSPSTSSSSLTTKTTNILFPKFKLNSNNLNSFPSTFPTIKTTKTINYLLENNLTIVTALLDIGRDRWNQYGRTMTQYHEFLKYLLQLRLPMVIFVDNKSWHFVHRERSRIGLGTKTKVRRISLSQLPFFSFKSKVTKIMKDELNNWENEWNPSMRSHPESSHPEYSLLVNSKTFFLVEAAAENPFGSEFFVWLDAGYGHGDRSIFPQAWQWQPTFQKGIISLIKLTPPTDFVNRYNLQSLYRQDISVISGGFIAGDRNSIFRLHQLYYKKFIYLIEKQKIDDDQTMLVLLINEYPEFFHIFYGDWFDAFELF